MHMFTMLLLAACSGGDKTDSADVDTDMDIDTDTDTDADTDTDTDTDTDPPPPIGTYVMDGDVPVRVAYIASISPDVAWRKWRMLGEVDATNGCPALTTGEDGTASYVADCTGESGFLYTGTLTVDAAGLTTYTGWSMLNDFGGGFALEGSETHSLIGEGLGAEYGYEGNVDVTILKGMGMPEELVVSARPYRLHSRAFLLPTFVSGTYDLGQERGIFYAQGTANGNISVCTVEPESGTWTLTGTTTVTITFDGKSDCDGCMAWADDSGLTGEICVETF
jgi:hypothetical protein